MTYDEFLADWQSDSPTLLVHTSGSTGKPKPLIVEKRRMAASALTTCQFLGLQAGDTALLCLPLDYIAGKMMVVRSIVCGLRLTAVEPSGHPLRDVSSAIDFAAMVPMQVYNSLSQPEERRRLMQIRHLIIGGGAIDEHLEAALRNFPNAVWSTYGMTETLSHIALRRISGPQASLWYEPFRGVSVSRTDEGCLRIEAPDVCPEVLITHDIVEMHADGRRFRILGRSDNTICSGGLKLQTEEIERRLRPHLPVGFMITKARDEKFGEVVVLLVETSDIDAVQQACLQALTPHERPKHIFSIERLPQTPTGKPARARAQQWVAEKMHKP